ncbi:hypothetical protein [Planococcus lenghuensis]|uniref:PRTRC system protein B n=1 Tax=Planococcus lenghuensis TaxID=2213202 RepID=A0A1Q2L4I4_9BACL|nr:hypothetical protein [Planococcus lenghuensis]AQQ55333.1 hypothetical protein B0X71_19355 [Planococcus lenghuensis]
MKLVFEMEDVPTNPNYPVRGFQYSDAGVRSGPNLLSIQQLIEMLEQRDPQADERRETRRKSLSYTPVLPTGTLMYASDDEGTLEQLVFEIQSSTFDVLYKDEKIPIALPFPRMVVIVELDTIGDQKKIDTMRVFAVENDGKPITADTPLYMFPYPNVMKSSGSVCWGQNSRLMVQSIQEVRSAFLLFFSSPFNEDHGVHTTHGIQSFRQLMGKIQDQPFNDEWLISSKQTLEESLRDLSY